MFDKIGDFEKAGFDRATPAEPKLNPKEIYGIIPSENSKQYNMHDVIYRLVDNSEFDEYKDKYGQSIICGTARIDGWAVGIVANQRKVVKSKKAKCRLAELFTATVPIKLPGLS